MKKTALGWLLVSFFLLAANGWGAEYFVAPGGSDGNPGTKEKPFASLDGARDAIRELKSGAGLPAGGVTVWVRGGRYAMKAPFILTPGDSGTEEAPIRYEAFPGEAPTLSGAVEIDGWRPVGKDMPGLRPEAAGQVQVADIPKGWRFHYLYCNDESLPCSRSVQTDNWREWPRDWKAGDFSEGGKLDPDLFSAKYTTNLRTVNGQVGWEVSLGSGVLNNTLPRNGDLEIFAVMRRYGVTAHAVLANLDPAAGTAVWLSDLTPPWPNVPRKKMEYEHCYRLENAVCFISREGEWAVDSANGKVYCWVPGGTTRSHEFAAPAVYNLIMLMGSGDKTGPRVHHVEIRGLTLECTDRRPENAWPSDWLWGPENLWENPDGTIYLRGVHDVVVDGCQILRPGAYGITLDRYAERVTLTRNRIDHAGSGGILLAGYGPGGLPSDVNKDNTIERNFISEPGQAYWHAPGICVFNSGSNLVRYNVITKVPYAGIIVGDVLKVDQINAGVHHNRPMLPGQKLGPFDFTQAWRICWDELPADAVAKFRTGAGDFTQAQLSAYLHNRDNFIAENVIADVHERFVEGGAIYVKYTGWGNVYHRNVIYSPGGAFGIAIDSPMLGAVVTENLLWADGPGGMGAYAGIPGREVYAKGNIQVNLDPRGAAKRGRPGAADGSWLFETSNAPFYERLDEIKAEVVREGGWPDGVNVDALGPARKAAP